MGCESQGPWVNWLIMWVTDHRTVSSLNVRLLIRSVYVCNFVICRVGGSSANLGIAVDPSLHSAHLCSRPADNQPCADFQHAQRPTHELHGARANRRTDRQTDRCMQTELQVRMHTGTMAQPVAPLSTGGLTTSEPSLLPSRIVLLTLFYTAQL